LATLNKEVAGTELEVGWEGYAEAASGSRFELVGGGRAPPERKDGQRDLSSGSDVPDESGDRWDRIAAAWVGARSGGLKCMVAGGGTYLQQLDLLMLAQHKFRSFAPLRGVFPSVLDKARWMAVDLKKFRDESIAKVKQRQLPITFEQLSQVKIVPLFLPPLVNPVSCMCPELLFGGEGKLTPSSRGTDLDMLSVWTEVLRRGGIGMADAATSIEVDAEVNEVET
jgi:hypothetical protein